MEEPLVLEAELRPRVPWGARQAWWGAAVLGGWLLAVLGVGVLALLFSIDIDLSLLLAFGELSLLLPVWWWVLRKYDGGWGLLGMRPSQGSVFGLGCGALVIFYTVLFTNTAVITAIGLESGSDYSLVLEDTSLYWGLALSAVLIAPFVEEIFFRGFLFAGFREKYGWKKAAALSALLFSLIHMQPLNIVPLFTMGFLFAYTYEKSGSLRTAIGMHAAVNGLSIAAIGVLIYFGA